MTVNPAASGPGPMPPPLAGPSHDVVPLYGEEFAADPYAVYERLREYGDLAPVEIAPGVGAMLVLDYRAALDLLHDPVTWSKDPTGWQETVPQDSPVMPMLRARPNALFTDGEVHDRYRRVISDSFARMEPHEVRRSVQEISDKLIANFGQTGEADLVTQYAQVLPLLFFNRVFGLPDSQGEKLVEVTAGMFNARTPAEAEEADAAYTRYLVDMVAAKQRERGSDLTSWFIDHPARMSDEEVVQQIALTMAAGHQALANLIGNALSRMLVDDRYYSNLSGGALTARDAIHDVLQNDPPMGNYSAHFPKRDVYFHGVWLRAGQLVLVSYAAASTQRGRAKPGESAGASGSGGGAHLAWAAGPHACPVQQPALLITMTAIERLTAWLSDIELTVPYDQLVWRPGPFQRGLAALPTRFTPISPEQAGETPWKNSPSSSTPSDATSTGRPTTYGI